MGSMRHAFHLAFILLSLASIATAQSHGYAFFAPGGASSSSHTEAIYHFGVGGDWVFWKGLGFSPELGYVNANQARFDSGFGVGSLNATYHFGRRAKLDPFVTAGYSAAFRTGYLNMANFGGGVNWWWRERMGLKVEFRDHVETEGGGSYHLWGVRFGLTFR